jgi:signal transduction histidine kinase/CheY-like chemotaxis protein
VNSTPITVNINNSTLLFSIIQDITSRKRAEAEKQELEQQLQHTQKLESLGVLSGGIAHDFNNILAIIKGNCSLATMDSENTENYINEIDKASDRAAALCRQMLAYAGKAQLTMTQVNMWMIVDEMATMLKSTLPPNAVIKPDLSTNITFINADASQLRQIVMNLIINASEAIGNKQGEIRILLANSTVSAGQSEKDYNGKAILPGKYVLLEVTDNGCGMDEETKLRIFEPFYTTKFTGRGLGMSAVLGIIKSHGGALQLFSQLGQGTTFKVYLPVPVKDSTGDENQNQSVPSTLLKGSGTILLVEDEDQVRLIAKALLKHFGFTVLEAVNGKEALELYKRNTTNITLVMTDMGMPIMDGYELFYELKKLNPELPIIVSSGYGDAEVGSRLGTDNIAGIISKPYGPDQLRDVLKSVVEGTHREVA